MKRFKLLNPTNRTGAVDSLICVMTEGDAVGKMQVFGKRSDNSGFRLEGAQTSI